MNKEAEEYIRVKVDTENYRKRRRETLENLAKNIAYKVKRSRRPVALEPMNPYERRIIHSALQNDKYVTTHSGGRRTLSPCCCYSEKKRRAHVSVFESKLPARRRIPCGRELFCWTGKIYSCRIKTRLCLPGAGVC